MIAADVLQDSTYLEGTHQDINIPCNTSICIAGSETLQNQLLSYVMTREIGARCIIHDCTYGALNPDQKIRLGQDPVNLLILIDAENKKHEQVLESIYSDATLCRGTIALFNLDIAAGIEKKALSLNVRGFFYKDDQLEVFIKGIRSVISGEIWVSRKMLLKYVMDSFNNKNIPADDKATLTCRESEILAFVCTGSTNEDIANKMCISTNTVKTHLYKIFKKIHVENRLQAALWTTSNL